MPRHRFMAAYEQKVEPPDRKWQYLLFAAEPYETIAFKVWDSFTVKAVLSGHSKRTQQLVFNTHYRLMQVKSIGECSKGSILQYFRPSLSYHFPLRPLFCLFLSGRLRQVLL